MNWRLGFIVFAIAALLRIWRLPEMAQFNYDEARDAIAEKQILSGDLTLLGPESLLGDKTIYFGPLHYYLMVPALKIFNLDPLGPYYLTAFLGGITAVIIFIAARSVWAGVFYAVFPLAVIYNRWAWNPNTIPLFAALIILFLTNNLFFLAGLAAGLAFQLHYMAIMTFGLILARWWLTGRRFRYLLMATFGFIVGISPMVVFDLRHDFLYVRTFLNSIGIMGTARSLQWHYFLWAVPALCLLAARLPNKICFVFCILSFVITVLWFWDQKIEPWKNLFYIKEQAKIIAGDQVGENTNFNVAAFINGDVRATSWRYFLELEGVKPLGIGEYDVADHLYVVSLGSRSDVLYNKTWEIASFHPVGISKSWQMGGANIYRLEKQ